MVEAKKTTKEMVMKLACVAMSCACLITFCTIMKPSRLMPKTKAFIMMP